MRKIVLAFIMLSSVGAMAQEHLSLFDCHDLAEQNHPLGLQKAEMESINQLNLQVIKSAYMPQLKLNGQATYQSDVVSIDLNIPNMSIPNPSNDQYKVYAELNQMIYDGGTTGKRKQFQNKSYEADLQQIEVDLYAVKQQINDIYFMYFTLDESLSALEVSKGTITKKLESVRSGVVNGVLLESAQLSLEAELLKLEQTLEEVSLSKETSLKILEILTGAQLESAQLTLPEDFKVVATDYSRPEHLLFQYQKDKLLTAESLKASENMPRVLAFGQLGYGKPGLNMLSNEFDSYYLLGLSFTWNLWDGQKVKSERQIYKVQSNLIDIQQQAFNEQLDVQLAQVLSEIEKLEQAIEKDVQIIDIQKQLLKSASSRLDNGVITSTEYITNLNNLTRAEINLKTNEIKLLQAKVNYKTIQGNL